MARRSDSEPHAAATLPSLTIAESKRRPPSTLEVPDVDVPVLIEDANNVAHGNDWVQGFMRSARGRPGWRDQMDSDEHGGLRRAGREVGRNDSCT